LFIIPAGLSEGQRAGISFAEWSKNGFFAPQRRHITPTLYITWRKDEVRVKEKNSKDSDLEHGIVCHRNMDVGKWTLNDWNRSKCGSGEG